MLEVSLAVRLEEARALVRGACEARGRPATTGKLAPLMPRLVARVMGRRGDAAIMRQGSAASTTRNDTPSAAAVERVFWARRHREAPPPAAPVAVPIVTGATHRLSMSGWGSPLGHSLGRTRPYWAVPGPTPGTYGRDDLYHEPAASDARRRIATFFDVHLKRSEE